jgi:2-phosphoglycerate kinase
MKKVICIGGPPMIGKSTAAVKLASSLGYACISTDDLGEALRAKIKTRELNPIAGQDYREYYLSSSIDRLIDDTRVQHRENWPAIRAVIKARSEWGHPLVLEGWNLYPHHIQALEYENTTAFWLTAGRVLLRKRLEENAAFWSGASDPELLIDRFTARSEWHCNLVRLQALEAGQPVIDVDESTSPEDICSVILEHL